MHKKYFYTYLYIHILSSILNSVLSTVGRQHNHHILFLLTAYTLNFANELGSKNGCNEKIYQSVTFVFNHGQKVIMSSIPHIIQNDKQMK